jgi:Domain of unknown function (DUF4386)
VRPGANRRWPGAIPTEENLSVTSGRTASVWERRAWVAGIGFVVAVLAETPISAGLPINQDDSAAKIASQLQDHRHIVLVAAYLPAVYGVAFVIYLDKLHDLLRRLSTPPGALHSLVLVGGVLLVAFHGVSDIGIYGLLGGKIATYAAHHDQGLSYNLYLLTFALDSVGDVFGSVFLIATGVLLVRTRVLPHWLAWIAVTSGTFLFVQGFPASGASSEPTAWCSASSASSSSCSSSCSAARYCSAGKALRARWTQAPQPESWFQGRSGRHDP